MNSSWLSWLKTRSVNKYRYPFKVKARTAPNLFAKGHPSWRRKKSSEISFQRCSWFRNGISPQFRSNRTHQESASRLPSTTFYFAHWNRQLRWRANTPNGGLDFLWKTYNTHARLAIAVLNLWHKVDVNDSR